MNGNDPHHWCNLSAELRQAGKLGEAAEAAQRALALDPLHAPALSHLAHALRWQGKLAEARAAAEEAVRVDPALAAGWFNLGAALVGLGQTEDGIAAYRRALELEPDFAEAWSNLGSTLAFKGDIDGEIEAYRCALAANPQLAPVWSNLGNALREAGQFEEAVTACRKAVELDPRFAAGWNNLSVALRERKEHAEAVEAAGRAVQFAPGYAEAWSNLGNALKANGRFEEAIRAHEQAIAISPGGAELHFNLGVAFRESGRAEAAITHYRRAVEIKPDHAEAHWNLGLALLRLGELRAGWDEYEWRWRRRKAEARRYDFTAWDGDLSKPRRLLLWAEQGIGDEILYGSMVGDLASSPMAIALEVDPRLVPLFQRSFPGVAVVPRRDPPAFNPARYDCQAPLASLGRWLRPSFSLFPRHAGYLRADAARVERYQAQLREKGESGAKIVGISWQSKNEEFGALKSNELKDWALTLKLPNVRFVDLQYGDTAEERRLVETQLGVKIEHVPDLDLFNDLDGLAALAAACDTVITVSNVTAHVAGALGRPVWLLAPKARGKIWYWFSNRTDSPWYPSMRIFNQKTAGNWREVLDEVAQELAAFVKER